jgi:hypothetical protein
MAEDKIITRSPLTNSEQRYGRSRGVVICSSEHAVQCGGQIVAGADSLCSRTGCGTV